MIAWIVALAGAGTGFFNLWTSFAGLWGHAIILIVPWLFVILQMSLTTGWTSETDSSVFLLTVNCILWIGGLLLHVLLVPLIEKWSEANMFYKPFDAECKCEKCVLSKYVAPDDIPRALMACTDNCERMCPPKQCAPEDKKCLQIEADRIKDRKQKLKQIAA